MSYEHISVETLSDYGISASANVSKSSVASLIKNMLMENYYKFKFLVLNSTSFRGGSSDLKYDIDLSKRLLNIIYENF